jgi:hypothetical protein
VPDQACGQGSARPSAPSPCPNRFSRVDLLHHTVHVVEQLVGLAGGKTAFKAPKNESGRAVDIPAKLLPILEDCGRRRLVTRLSYLRWVSEGGLELRQRSCWMSS